MWEPRAAVELAAGAASQNQRRTTARTERQIRPRQGGWGPSRECGHKGGHEANEYTEEEEDPPDNEAVRLNRCSVVDPVVEGSARVGEPSKAPRRLEPERMSREPF